MKFWTAHLCPGAAPVMVAEGFSWGALAFGPLWLLAHRAWVPAVLMIAAQVTLSVLAGDAMRAVLFPALILLLGLSGNDLVRFTLERRGYALAHVIAARDDDGAFARLLAARPDLAYAAAADGAADGAAGGIGGAGSAA